MSIVIIGGNECMECQYKNLCKKYGCKAKVFTKVRGVLRNQIGCRNLLVLFTGTMSHKMAKAALNEAKGLDTIVERSHAASMNALKEILEKHVAVTA